MDVLLIHPPVNLELKKPIQSSYYVGYGLLHIAACLVQNGYDVVVWNLGAYPKLDPRVLKAVFQKHDPIAVGVELNWLGFSRGAIQIAKLLKEVKEEVPIVVGGTHASILATEIVQNYPAIDIVLKGEAEKTFPTLVKKIEDGKTVSDVAGLVSYEEGKLRDNPITNRDVYEDLDDIPPYSSKIIRNLSDGAAMTGMPLASIDTVRGPCHFNCPYCLGGMLATIQGRHKFAQHSSNWIVDQISLLIDEGQNEFAFQDYLFLVGQQRLIELAQALRREKITERILGINMTGLPGLLKEQALEELSRAGIYNIDYGVETGSDHILQAMGRPSTQTVVLDAMKTTVKKGIIPFTWWMNGFPDERAEDVKETIRFIHKTAMAGSIPRWITPLIVLPGTKLFHNAEDYGISLRLHTFEDFAVYSNLSENALAWYPEAISHTTQHLSHIDILRLNAKMKIETYKRRDAIVENFMKTHAKQILSYHPQISAEALEYDLKEVMGYVPKSFY
jgi:anaerobic magnesium-protoporphyrin IX monomethyl ester cyclase